MIKYSETEIMALKAARFVKDGDIVFAGIGISMLAATTAKRIYAPNSVIFFETGGIDPSLNEIPLAVADSRVMSKTSLNSGLIESFSIIGSKKLETIAFLGAAQVDKYGNLNTTCIGDYNKPKIRFAGSGGGSDVCTLAYGYIVFMKHEKQKFVEKLDYLTSVGWYKGGNSRKELHLERGGPIAVVTNLCVIKFDAVTKEMYMAEYFPGVNPEDIQKNTGFDIDISRAVETVLPTEEELRILREEVDPQRLML